MDELTIGEVSRLTSIPDSTLRYYESIGLLLAPRRVSGVTSAIFCNSWRSFNWPKKPIFRCPKSTR